MPIDLDDEEGYGRLGRELIESGWFKQKKKMHNVRIRDFEEPEYCIVQGGAGTGTNKCHIIPNNDVALTHQTIPM